MKAPLFATAFGLVAIAGLLPQVREQLPATQLTGGLDLSLAADRDSVAVGETVMLTTTIRNLTDQQIPLNVAWGQETFFDLGWGLHRVVETGGNPPPELLKPRNRDGSRFTLIYHEPRNHVVNPKEAVSWQTKLRLCGQGRDTYFEVGNLRTSLLGSRPGMCRLRWVYAIDPWELKSTWGVMCSHRGQAAELPPFWTGTLHSNDVWIGIVPPIASSVK